MTDPHWYVGVGVGAKALGGTGVEVGAENAGGFCSVGGSVGGRTVGTEVCGGRGVGAGVRETGTRVGVEEALGVDVCVTSGLCKQVPVTLKNTLLSDAVRYSAVT